MGRYGVICLISSALLSNVSLMSIVPPAWGQGYSIKGNKVIVEGKDHWEGWRFPKGIIEITDDGWIRPIFIRKNINAALNAGQFMDDKGIPGGIRKAGSNPDDAVNIMDGDLNTWWEPNREDSLNTWWVEVNLGRVVTATRIVLRFVEKREGDPFLGFKVLTSNGERHVGTDLLVWREAGRTKKPNRERQRLFEFDLKAPKGNEGEGDVVQYVRLVVTDSYRDKAEEVSQKEYEALDPDLRGAIEYFRKGPTGGELLIGRKGYEKLDPSLRGSIKYYRREMPRLAELEVWSLGDNISLELLNRGGYTTHGPQMFDGSYETSAQLSRLSQPWHREEDEPVKATLIDLGATFWVDVIRILRPPGFGAQPRMTATVYRIKASDGSMAPGGGLIWETLTPESRFSTWDPYPWGLRALYIEDRFELRKIRLLNILFRYSPLVSELQVYGEGYIPEITLTSPLIELGGAKDLSSIHWEGNAPPGTKIKVSTRTGDQLGEEIHYFDSGGREVTLLRYNKLPGFAQGPTVVEKIPGADWSSWSRPYRQPVDLITSPSPRKHLMIQVRLTSEDPHLFPSLKSSLSIDFFPPLAQQVVGEIWPFEILRPGAPQSFSLIIRPKFIPSNPGFDWILISSSLVDDMELLGIRLGGEEDDVEFLSSDDLEVVSTRSDSILVRLPEMIKPGGVGLIEVQFKSTVFLHNTPFKVFLGNSHLPDSWQRVDPGDAVDLVESQTMTVSVPFGGRIIRDVEVFPNPFTPNGDGVNDEVSFNFTVLEVYTGKPVEVVIYTLAGRVVRRLSECREVASGRYSIPWGGGDEFGRMVPPGIYLARISVDVDSESAKGTTVDRLVCVVY